MKLLSINNCTGCSACYSSCPKSAIMMKEDSEGFLYPQIDESKCVECGICEKVCPAINPLTNNDSLGKSYTALHKDEGIRMKSSSGGFFTALAEMIIDEGGVVFGAKFTDDFSVIHSWTDSKDGLADFRGSKYLQSVTGDTYKDCEGFLKQGRKVLFTGTPCQIQGLKKFLKKEYENLVTADLICTGVPCNALWQKYIDYICDKNNVTRNDVTAVTVRNKDNGWKRYSISFVFNNGMKYTEPQTKGAWMDAFNKYVMMRKSCYNCPAKGVNIVSDITLGDFWGIEYYTRDFDDKGTSIIFANTPCGHDLLEKIAGDLIITEIDNYKPEKYNGTLVKSVPMNKHREDFIQNCISGDFMSAYIKYVKDGFFMKLCKYAVYQVNKITQRFRYEN